jgi:hypothetical protein
MKMLKNLAKWQNYAHYLLLAGAISVVAYQYGAPIDWPMFFVLAVALFVFDTLIHALFWVLPKPFQWRD